MEKQLNNPKEKTPTVKQKPDDMLTKAIRKRDLFLKNRPNMLSYQKEIDTILDKAGDSEGRMAVLGMLMEGKLAELRRSLGRLNKIVETLPR